MGTPINFMVLMLQPLPFQGMCQGNGASPAIRLVVSIVLMEMVWSHGYTATISSPITHQSMSLLGLLYVDNCDLLDGSQPIETIHCLQTNINLWQGGLTVLGRALSPTNLLGVFCLCNHKAPTGNSTPLHPSQLFLLLRTPTNNHSLSKDWNPMKVLWLWELSNPYPVTQNLPSLQFRQKL